VPAAAFQLPTFQLLSIGFATGAFVLAGIDRYGLYQRSSQPIRWLGVLMGVIGLLGSNALYVFAMRLIPPAQANLISYLWPIMIVVIASCLGLLTMKRRQMWGVAIGLFGATLVIGGSDFTLSWLGIGLAFSSAIAWAAFCIFRMLEGEAARPVLTPAFTGSAIVAVIVHLVMETTVIPSAASLLLAVLIGILPLGLGAILWDNGLRRGRQHLLATLAYATPLLGVLMLLLCGFATPSISLFFGGIMIVAAGVISGNTRT
jgi:drug/metabolite transporter (DMT)-like permease